MSIKFVNSLQLEYVNQFEVGDHFFFEQWILNPPVFRGLQGPIRKWKHQYIIRLLISYSDFV